MPVSIQASAISHIALCVRDLERSLQFYRDGLGFQVTKDEVQDTSRGGLPHLYTDRHAQRRVVHLRYGNAQSVPFLVLTEHPARTATPTTRTTAREWLGLFALFILSLSGEWLARRRLGLR